MKPTKEINKNHARKKRTLILAATISLLAGAALGYYLASSSGLLSMVFVRSDAYNDKKIWKLAEDDSYKVPEGFYYEANDDSSIKYYEDGPNTFYCAKSTEDAISTVNRYLAEYNEDYESLYRERLADSDVNETEKYFEFNLEQFDVRYNQSSHVYWFRIFNCSYISDLHYGRYDKVAYNTEGSDSSKYAGKFAKTPISNQDVYDLVGFLWHTTSYKRPGKKIIASSVSNNKDTIEVILIEMEKSSGDLGLPDIIGINQLRFSVNKNTGVISYSQEDIRNIEG